MRTLHGSVAVAWFILAVAAVVAQADQWAAWFFGSLILSRLHFIQAEGRC